jgi:ATP-dependent RNA helicase DDX31/DBP7
MRQSTQLHHPELMQELCDHLVHHKFSVPTAVQKEAIPALLSGRDLMMRAQTGTGKTIAYLAPIVQSLAVQSPRVSRGEGCYALVVTPTRELTLQVPKHLYIDFFCIF